MPEHHVLEFSIQSFELNKFGIRSVLGSSKHAIWFEISEFSVILSWD